MVTDDRKKYIEMEGVFSGSRVINIYLPDDYNERRKKYPVLLYVRWA